MSKGSNPRPFEIPREVYESRHDMAFGAKPPKPRWVPPPLPDVPKSQQQENEHGKA